MSSSPNHVGDFRGTAHTIGSAQASIPIVLWTPQVPAQRAQDGETHVRGSRVHAIVAANSDGSNSRVVQISRATRLTTQDGSQGLQIATTTTVTRATGNFVTDGWRVGDMLHIVGATTAANGALVRVSGVAALTLTVGTLNTVEALPTGAELLRVMPLLRPVALATSQGYTTASTPMSLLHPDYLPALADRPDTCVVLGPLDRLLGHTTTTVAAGQAVDLWCEGGDY